MIVIDDWCVADDDKFRECDLALLFCSSDSAVC